MIGRDIAARVIASHGTADLESVVEAEGLIVETRHPWKGNFQDLYVYPHIFVPRGLSAAELRSRVAHCLDHHFLHPGNQIWMRGLDRAWSWKMEYQAEEFAAWLLVPEDQSDEVKWMSIAEVATRYQVDDRLAEARIRMVERAI